MLTAHCAVGFAQVWQEPQLSTTELAANQECYLYNVGAGKFYTEGNAYGTQGSLGNEGLRCKFVSNGEVYKLTNYSNVKGSWRTTFVTTNGALYVDGENVTECWWKIVDNGNGTFKLMMSTPNNVFNQDNYPGAMMGLDLFEDPYRTALAAILMEAEEPGENIYHTDWAVVTSQSYNQYQKDVVIYKTAIQLGELINEAHDKGMDVSDEEIVYNNTASTLSQLQSAIGSVTGKLLAEELAGASMDNPIDVTSKFITNPDYANNDNTGWKGNVQPGIDANSNLQNAEFFNTNYDTYQDIINLPEGYYRLSIQGFYRAGLEGPALDAKQNGTEANVMHAELYATTGGKTTTTKIQSIFTEAPTEKQNINGEINLGSWWVPNNMASAAGYFAKGYYNGTRLIIQVTNTKLRIGIRKNTTIRRDWTMFDNWKLEYLGKQLN